MSDDLIRRSDAISAFIFNSKGERIPFVDCDNFPVEFPLKYIVDTLAALPPTDRPQGEWILSEIQDSDENANDNYAYNCSICGRGDVHAKTQDVPYCWWCGARMRPKLQGTHFDSIIIDECAMKGTDDENVDVL